MAKTWNWTRWHFRPPVGEHRAGILRDFSKKKTSSKINRSLIFWEGKLKNIDPTCKKKWLKNVCFFLHFFFLRSFFVFYFKSTPFYLFFLVFPQNHSRGKWVNYFFNNRVFLGFESGWNLRTSKSDTRIRRTEKKKRKRKMNLRA